MKAITDVRDISRIAYAFMASRALFAGLELDLFTRLSGQPKSISLLASEGRTSPNHLRTLLVALASLGLVIKRGDVFANAPAAEAYLVRGAPKYYGEYLRVVNGKFNYRYLVNLDNTLRGDSVAEEAGFYGGYCSTPEEVEEFSRAQHAGSLGPAAVLAKQVDLSGCKALLDVGGGSGAFTIALCRRNPTLAATILDFPDTVEVARRYAAETGLASRIRHLAGDALATDWPPNQDVVLMSYVWSAVGEDDIENLADRAHAALIPGGRLLIHDFMVDDEQASPEVAAWHLLLSTINNPKALCLTPSGITARLQGRGFDDVVIEPLVPGITSLAVARRAVSS
jgi:precorrin-6B methylase 2